MAAIGNMEDGVYSCYSAQPSETNVSINEALSKEMTAINEAPDEEKLTEISASIYSMPESETNVTMAMSDYSAYSVPKSEKNVSMSDRFGVLYSTNLQSEYTVPKSETNVTLRESFKPCEMMKKLENNNISMYTSPKSEVNVSMSDGFNSCGIMKGFSGTGMPNYEAEKTAISEMWTSKAFNSDSEFNYIQNQLGISDECCFGLAQTDGTIARAVDSIECLKGLESFEPRGVDLEAVMRESRTIYALNPSMEDDYGSVESYLLKTSASSVHHEI